MLATQLWDTYTGLERQGQLLPKNSWTIHGLWPDNCDGSFDGYCDLSRQYDPAPSPATLPNGTLVPVYRGPSIATFIEAFGRYDLLAYSEFTSSIAVHFFTFTPLPVSKYWVSQGSPNADFWAHEFSKHATCTSTFDLACYGPGYKKHQEVVDFFQAATRAFKQYPTFDMLASYVT